MNVWRIIDANANRTAEGLRVVEEFTRFILGDAHLTELAKQLRHDFAAAMATLPATQLLAARDTQTDVGVAISTASEFTRPDARSVATANCKRVEQSLRVLEEYAKVVANEAASRFEQLRYRAYTLARAIGITSDSRERLAEARLYVLVDGAASTAEFAARIETLVAAGVHVLQLRDKRLDDRELLGRARLLRRLTRESRTLFVMNDRPDLAVLSQADGVHVGQEELIVADVRAIVGTEMLIGVSTHSLAQARQAVLDGANYLGCGPTFPSGTKTFEQFPGLEFLRAVASEIRLPAFAIGGIDAANLPGVLATGFTRVAVSGAVSSAGDPAVAVRELLSILGAKPGE